MYVNIYIYTHKYNIRILCKQFWCPLSPVWLLAFTLGDGKGLRERLREIFFYGPVPWVSISISKAWIGFFTSAALASAVAKALQRLADRAQAGELEEPKTQCRQDKREVRSSRLQHEVKLSILITLSHRYRPLRAVAKASCASTAATFARSHVAGLRLESDQSPTKAQPTE